MNRIYLDYIQDILDSIKDIESFVKGMTFETFKKDRKTINAVVRSIEVIGEASKNIPSAIKTRYANVPWKKMAGMRDKLIHEYFGVDAEILWKVSREEIKSLKSPMKQILKGLKR
jgi:uncharacterized protein with HEPN domain